MKTFFLLLASFFFASQIQAQNINSCEQYRKRIEEKYLNSVETKKSRAVKQRLIVDSTYTNDGTGFKFWYTTYYFYSNERGCTQNNEENAMDINCKSDSSFGYSFLSDIDKNINKYDVQNNLTENTFLQYSPAVQAFIPFYKSVLSYNGLNRIEIASYFEYVINQWKPTTNVYYQYDTNNQLEKKLKVDFGFNGWDSTEKYEYQYFANNISAADKYIFVNNLWKIKEKNTYSYNPQNKVALIQNFSQWNGTFFEDTTVTNYLYDPLSRIDSMVFTTWSFSDTVAPVPYVFGKRKYTYNGSDTNMTSFISYGNIAAPNNKIEFAYDINKNLINMKHYSYQLPDPYNQYINYHYENYNVTSINEKESFVSDIQLSPNPANTFITLIFDSKNSEETEINILDISGRIVYMQKNKCKIGINNINIPVSRFNKGIFFVNLSSNGRKIKCVKFVKE